MSLSLLKGKILEYTVRQILIRCGFYSVEPDDLFIYNHGLLQYINGKGAAHDADVLMNPPIQMPFGYPARLLFECKAYSGNISLPIIRNVAGLREDINSFEIVTENFLADRRNNRRTTLAIHDRKRHIYQVGIASIKTFTKPATEFAANNKIPLFSLQETFNDINLIQRIEAIPSNYAEQIGENNKSDLINILSERNNIRIEQIEDLINQSEVLASVFEILYENLNRIHVAMLESGDLVFLKLAERFNINQDIFSQNYISSRNVLPQDFYNREMTIHWYDRQSNIWQLELGEHLPVYNFYLPSAVVEAWEKDNRSKRSALELKLQFLSRIIVFNNTNANTLPFKILRLNRNWINEL